MFPNQIPFNAAQPAWEEIPTVAGVFALFGEDARAEPYISRTPNLRRRLRRLLDARPDQSKRLQLAGRVARIEYALTGSDFEARPVFGSRMASWHIRCTRSRLLEICARCYGTSPQSGAIWCFVGLRLHLRCGWMG